MSRPRMTEKRLPRATNARQDQRIFEIGIGNDGTGGLLNLWHVGAAERSDRLRIDLYRIDGPVELIAPAEHTFISRKEGPTLRAAALAALVAAAREALGVIPDGVHRDELRAALDAIEVRG